MTLWIFSRLFFVLIKLIVLKWVSLVNERFWPQQWSHLRVGLWHVTRTCYLHGHDLFSMYVITVIRKHIHHCNNIVSRSNTKLCRYFILPPNERWHPHPPVYPPFDEYQIIDLTFPEPLELCYFRRLRFPRHLHALRNNVTFKADARLQMKSLLHSHKTMPNDTTPDRIKCRPERH